MKTKCECKIDQTKCNAIVKFKKFCTIKRKLKT